MKTRLEQRALRYILSTPTPTPTPARSTIRMIKYEDEWHKKNQPYQPASTDASSLDLRQLKKRQFPLKPSLLKDTTEV